MYKFVNALKIDDNASLKLSRLLDRIVKGSDTVLRTPVGVRESSDLILARWDKIYKSKIDSISNELNELEISNRSKYGPRSVTIPWVERKDSVYSYFSPQKSIPELTTIEPPIKRRLRPLSLDGAVRFLKSSTSSGLPYYLKKSEVKDVALRDFAKLLQRKDPALLFTRTQEARKTRAVWGYPIGDTLNETRFYRPLLLVQREMPWRSSLLGPDAVNISISNLITEARSRSSSLVSIDFSAYDTTVKYKLQRSAFEYIKSMFQSEFHSEIDYIFDRFSRIGLVTPDGILSGRHGVPSGSTFTNEIDSIVQYLIAKSFGIEDHLMDIQGDDAVYVTDDPDGLISYFESFGLVVNKDKGLVDEGDVVYLQNLHSPRYTDSNGLFNGIYPTYRALCRIIFPERFTDYVSFGVDGVDFNSIRTISILENCRYHPLFEELVKFVWELDKYALSFSRIGLKKYINHLSLEQVPGETFGFKYGDYLNGIYGFRTVEVLSRLKTESALN